MFACNILVVLTLGFVQLSSSPDTEEMLVQTLVELDELNQTYCARFAGTFSAVSGDLPDITEIGGISAKTDKGLQFHTYGSQSSGDFLWNDALRDARSSRRRFKVGTAASIAQGIADQKFDEDSSRNNGNGWPRPEINPFGMIFGGESRLVRRNSEFEKIRNGLANNFEFQKSRLLKNGNAEGTWLFRTKPDFRVTIEFDRNHENLPVVVKYDRVSDKLIIGLTKTKWKKYEQDRFVPETICVISERLEGSTTVQIDMKWEWLPLEKWKSWSEKNFDGLFNKNVNDFRTPIVELFELQPKKPAT